MRVTDMHNLKNNPNGRKKNRPLTNYWFLFAFPRSDLDDVSGVGPKTKKALLVHFGSVKAIAQASPDDLMQVSGVGESMAERIVQHFSRLDKR